MKLDAKIPSGPLAQKWDKHRFDMKLVNPAHKRKFEVIVVGAGPGGLAAGQENGATPQNRTGDTVIFSHVLYQLS